MIEACGADGLSSACALAIRLKYSKARRSSWATPSPSAYIRPSFHCATGWPPSAAYCSEDNELVGATAAVAGAATRFRAAAAPGWAETTGSAVSCGLTGAPSKANPGTEAGMAPNSNAKMIRLYVRITLFLVRTTWMSYRAIHRWPNLLGIFPQRTRRVVSRSGRPFGLTFGELFVGQFYVKSADVGIDLDNVTILQQGDRPADGGFRPDMADAEAPGGAGKPAVGDQGDLAAHALPGQRRRGREHLPHAGTAARPLIADHDDLAFLVGLFLDRLEGILFAVEAAGRSGKFQVRHAGDLHDRALRREIPLQADHTARDGDRLVVTPHHVLMRIPFHALEIFRNRPAGNGQTVAVKVSMVEQCLHQKRYATNLEHVFGNITTARLQIRDIWCLFEDFGDVEQVELDAAFMRNRRQMQPGIGRAAGRGYHRGCVFQRFPGDDGARA